MNDVYIINFFIFCVSTKHSAIDIFITVEYIKVFVFKSDSTSIRLEMKRQCYSYYPSQIQNQSL